VAAALAGMAQEARELYIPAEVPRLPAPPTPLAFYRDWVSQNRPVVVEGGVAHWSALTSWTDSHLATALGNTQLTVAVTPDGFADAARGDRFVMPLERKLTMAQFLRILQEPDSTEGVHYIQKQNSNLSEEFSAISGDVEGEVGWASEAFGQAPDAVNFWMGDGRAVTSMHKDPYENIYCVVRGWKEVTLQPPHDVAWLKVRQLSPAIYRPGEAGQLEARRVAGPRVPWVCPAPRPAPNATVLTVKLKAGDLLYLPSLWYHALTQSHGCIAVNYWYDMQFGPNYSLYNLVSNLKQCIIGNDGAELTLGEDGENDRTDEAKESR